jgi:hypothetical protein
MAAAAVLCLALLALLSIAQVTHTHAVANDADHCQLCMTMHSAAPTVAAVAPIALVQVARTTPAPAVRPVARLWHAQLFIRPPPAGCQA